jgi:hypothetical protein
MIAKEDILKKKPSISKSKSPRATKKIVICFKERPNITLHLQTISMNILRAMTTTNAKAKIRKKTLSLYISVY